MFDCIIVGASLPGLALGAMLSKSGRRVLLLERKGVAGGRAAPWHRDGYTSLPGIPRIRYGEKGPFYRICRFLGWQPPIIHMNRAWVLDTHGNLQRITVGRPGLLRAEFLAPLDRFFAWRLLRALRTEKLEELDEESLEEWFVRNKIRVSLQKYLRVLACESTHCTTLDRISAGETLRSFCKAFQLGAYLSYPRWGWLPVFERFQQEIRSNGEIRLRTRVESIETRQGKVVGVNVAGRLLKCDCVVCAIPCQQLFRILAPGVTTSEYVGLCTQAKPSMGLIVDFALSHRVSGDKGLWFFLDPPAYGAFLSNLCHRHAPVGRQLVSFVCPCSPEEARQPEVLQTLEIKIEANLRKACPAMETALEWKRSHLMRMLDSVATRVDQTRKDRPGYRVPQVEGLYLVGDSTFAPGSSWDMEYESVLACFERITGQGV